MCYEDIRIGYRRSTKYTPCNSTTVQIIANKNRVVLRLIASSVAAAESFAGATPLQGNNTMPAIWVNQGNPVNELIFERHGSGVQEAFNVTSTGTVTIMEVLDNDLPNALMQGDPIEQGKYTQYR